MSRFFKRCLKSCTTAIWMPYAILFTKWVNRSHQSTFNFFCLIWIRIYLAFYCAKRKFDELVKTLIQKIPPNNSMITSQTTATPLQSQQPQQQKSTEYTIWILSSLYSHGGKESFFFYVKIHYLKCALNNHFFKINLN